MPLVPGVQWEAQVDLAYFGQHGIATDLGIRGGHSENCQYYPGSRMLPCSYSSLRFIAEDRIIADERNDGLAIEGAELVPVPVFQKLPQSRSYFPWGKHACVRRRRENHHGRRVGPHILDPLHHKPPPNLGCFFSREKQRSERDGCSLEPEDPRVVE